MQKTLNILIALVWFMNGLFCKVLNFVPRHAEIVKTILHLNQSSSHIITVMIGSLEILMAIWILSGYQSKINAIVQITIVSLMNILEYFLVPDLLLWGKLNALFALIFVVVVYFNSFIFNKKSKHAIIT
ncbi:MAG: DoxX-like family protein [Gelidibacter sp.]